MIHGEPFNYYRTYRGVFVPDGLLAAGDLAPGAKLCWALLVRRGGSKGDCFPSERNLSTAMGVSARQVRRYLRGLVTFGLLRADPRPGHSNRYITLGHVVLGGTVPPGVDISVQTPRTDMSTQSGQKGPREGQSVKRVNEVQDLRSDPHARGDVALLEAIRRTTGQTPAKDEWYRLLAEAELRRVNLVELANQGEQRSKRLREKPQLAFFFHLIRKWSTMRPIAIPSENNKTADKLGHVPAAKCPTCGCPRGKGLLVKGDRVIPCPDCAAA